MSAARPLIWLFVLFTRMSYAQEIPVLPLPVHVEQEQGSTLPFSSALTFAYIGIDNTAKAGLQAHWNKFIKAHPTAGTASRLQIQLGLIGKNKQFDVLIARPAAQWRDKIGKEGYLLIFNEKQRIIAANTETGLFYGLQTLKQLIRANWKQALLIADYPSFEHRAVYDDISRGPISTVTY